jgi:hypothetical protein
MFLAITEHTRIGSGSATLVLVAVLSFASGIFISMMATDRPQIGARSHVPCPVRCERLILMSTQDASVPEDESASCDLAESI